MINRMNKREGERACAALQNEPSSILLPFHKSEKQMAQPKATAINNNIMCG